MIRLMFYSDMKLENIEEKRDTQILSVTNFIKSRNIDDKSDSFFHLLSRILCYPSNEIHGAILSFEMENRCLTECEKQKSYAATASSKLIFSFE